jgi:hypothetical protein
MVMVLQEQEYLIISISKKQAEQAQLPNKLWVLMKKESRLFLKDLTKIRTNIGKKLSRIALR